MTEPVAARVETAVWALIYGGLLMFGLGLSLQRGQASTLGWVLAATGAVAASVGVLLIWVRSRTRTDPEPPR